ncbi:MAG: class I SAM-dependent methyltransferase [Jatrophihabitans sp.]|nr:MAG: class I SAM-dependent methyltransferase [Jatrophihabitans sp.]
MTTSSSPATKSAYAACHDDAAYVDFMVGLRRLALGEIKNAAVAASEAELARRGEPIRDVLDLRRLLDPVPVIALRNRVVRSVQEKTWRRVADTVHGRASELLAEIAEAERRGPGSVHCDPQLTYPEYYTVEDIHLQPGSYYGDPLAGAITEYGGNVFYAGLNLDGQVKQASVGHVPLPADGVVTRVLDLACSIGQSTTAFKQRFPDARVTGIDIAAPMVRYAHRRAIKLGVDVEFRQESAAALSFPDAAFDLVYCNILFHEVPRDVAERVVTEAHRVLRPGGVFVVVDFANRPAHGPMDWGDYHRNVDCIYNGEPFASAFVYSDFTTLLESVFPVVDPDHHLDPGGIRLMRVCTR